MTFIWSKRPLGVWEGVVTKNGYDQKPSLTFVDGTIPKVLSLGVF